MSDTNGHGGKREGAGRPRDANSVRTRQANSVVDRKIRTAAEDGWEVLADNYPDIIRKAVDVALGNDKKMPNVTMLKVLLELMVKIAGVEPENEDNALKQLVERIFVDRVHKARVPDERDVDGNSGGSIQHFNSGHVVRPDPTPEVPRMGISIPFKFPE